MKVTADRKIESATLETLEIKIEFDPSKPVEEGYAALIATMCDTVRHVLVLEKAVEAFESES